MDGGEAEAETDKACTLTLTVCGRQSFRQGQPPSCSLGIERKRTVGGWLADA
jgi:hypothetical protein